MEDVFDAPRAEPMTAAEFAAIGAEDWERVTLHGQSGAAAAEAALSGERVHERRCAAASGRASRARARRSSIVFRRGFQVFRRDQEPEQFRLLQALVAGRPLAAAVRASIGRQHGQRRSRREAPRRAGSRNGRGAHLFVKGDGTFKR